MLDVLGVVGVAARAFGLLVALPTGEALSTLPRLFIAVCFALALAPVVEPSVAFAWPHLLLEFIIGLMLAMPARFLAEAGEMFGEVLDTARGQTIGSVVDPLNGQQVSDMATLIRLGIVVLVVSLGGLDVCVRSLGHSFGAFPLGGDGLPNMQVAEILQRGLATVSAALSISSVWLFGYLLTDIGAGLLSKVVQGLCFTSTATVVKMVLTFILFILLMSHPSGVTRFVAGNAIAPESLMRGLEGGAPDPEGSHE
jgi:flagellar biosynthesis protein FliR